MRFVLLFPLWLATVIMASPTPEPQEKADSTSTTNKDKDKQVTGQNNRNSGGWNTLGAGAIGVAGGVLATLGVQRFQTIRQREQFEQWLASVDEYNFGTAWTAPQVLDCMSRKVFLLPPHRFSHSFWHVLLGTTSTSYPLQPKEKKKD